MKKMKYGILIVLAVLALVSVASALPLTAHGTIHNPGPSSYWNVYLDTTSPSPDSDLPVPFNYAGWCADSEVTIGQDSTHTFDVSSSINNPAVLPHLPTANWQKINWMLNNYAAYTSDWHVVQMVIWHFDGQPGTDNYPWGSGMDTSGPSTTQQSEYVALRNAAETNGGGWTIDCAIGSTNNKYAIILYDQNKAQAIFVPGTCTSIPSPEFPSLALPMGMLVGLIGAVYVIKGREK